MEYWSFVMNLCLYIDSSGRNSNLVIKITKTSA